MGVKILVVAALMCGACHSTHASGDAANRATDSVVAQDATATSHRILVAILGQSNAEGIGDATDPTLDPVLLAPYPIVYNAMIYSYVIPPIAARGYGDTSSGASYALYDYGKLQPFYYNLAHPDFGIELTLGRDLDAMFPGQVTVTKFAMGGSQLDAQWLPTLTYPGTGPNLAHRALTWVRDAYEACGCDRLVIVWEQGEQDAGHIADAQAYAANLGTLVAFFRARWPGVPWVIGRLNSDAVNSGKAPYTSTVQTQQAAYVATDPDAVLVDQDGASLGSDHLHYTGASYFQLGHWFAQAIQQRLGS